MRRLSVAFLVLSLAGCGEPGGKAQSGEDPRFAGLDHEIHAWRAQIVKTDETCLSNVKDEKCVAFEVTCKIDQPLTDADKAAGIVSRVVVALRWQGWNAGHGEHRSVLKAAEFSNTGKAWVRKDAGGVNPNTCLAY